VAIALGQDLAKQIAQSPVSVRLHSFETTLLAGTHVAVRQNGGQVSSGENGALRSAIGSLARSYSRVMVMGEYDEYYRDPQEYFSPLEDFGLGLGGGLYEYYGYQPGAIPVSAPVPYIKSVSELQKLFRGQTSATTTVQFVDRLLQAATRVESLHRLYSDSFNNEMDVRYIQYGGFLRELVEFGFEIMRVKPTTTVGSNPASEWIENLLEGDGSEASLKLAAEGLAKMFEGFRLNADADSMYQVGDALDLAGRAMIAATRMPSYQTLARDSKFLQAQIAFAKGYLLAPDDISSDDHPFLGQLLEADTDEKISAIAAMQEAKIKAMASQPIVTEVAFADRLAPTLIASTIGGTASNQPELDSPISDSEEAWRIGNLSYIATHSVNLESGGLVTKPLRSGVGSAQTFSTTNGQAILAKKRQGDGQIIRRSASGKITVFDEDEDFTVRDGDTILWQAATPLQVDVLRQELNALRGIDSYWRSIADIISGAVYEYLKSNTVGALIEIANFLFPWNSTQNNLTVEAWEQTYLPQSIEFEIGRTIGAGAAFLQGIKGLITGITKLPKIINGLNGVWEGGLALNAVGTGRLAITALSDAVAPGKLASSGKRLLDDIYDRYGEALERRRNEAIQRKQEETVPDLQGKNAKDLTSLEKEIVQNQSELKAARKKELKAVEKQIKDLKSKGVSDEDPELIDLRHERYLIKNVDNSRSPQSVREWLTSQSIARQNRSVGEIAQENVLRELGLPDNNQRGVDGRIAHTIENLGSTIPDAVTSKFWIDVKSVNTADGVYSYTNQLRIQKAGALEKGGKELAIIMTGKNPVRPTLPLERSATVLKFDETTKGWSLWDIRTKQWNTRTLSDIKQLLGN
jgi:hypothetical protein